MISTQMRGDSLGVVRLIVAGSMKADRECLYWAVALRLHHRNHGRRIDSARQKGAERHISNHTQYHRNAKKSVELLNNLSLVGLRIILVGA